MKLQKCILMLSLAGLITGCATTPDSESDAVAEAASAGQTTANVTENSSSERDPNELICRREQVTGSNFRRRVCLTRAERKERQDEIQRAMEQSRSAVP